MPELYVGNISKQTQIFAYRALERTGIVTQTIPIGGQIRISPNGRTFDLSVPEIEFIIDQHKIYGIVDVTEISGIRSPFTGLVYSIGKEISVSKLRDAMVKKEQVMDEFGKKIRQEAALAVNSQLEQTFPGELRNLEMSFTEEEPRGGYSDDITHISEGVRVTRDAEQGPPVSIASRRSRK